MKKNCRVWGVLGGVLLFSTSLWANPKTHQNNAKSFEDFSCVGQIKSHTLDRTDTSSIPGYHLQRNSQNNVLAAPGTAKQRVGVLDLDISSEEDTTLLLGNYFQITQEELQVSSLSGDKLSALSVLYGCLSADSACFRRVANGLDVQWLIYGSVSTLEEGLSIELNLFSARVGKKVSSVTTMLSTQTDTEPLRAAIKQLLSREKVLLEDSISDRSPKSSSRIGRFVGPGVTALGAIGLGIGAILVKQNIQNSVGQLNEDQSTALRNKGLIFSIGSDALALTSGVWFLLSLTKKRPGKKSDETISAKRSER